ncbi:MAG TPA: hypothetical protein VGB99_04745 [Acidobacteriota bacterium]
MAKKKAAKKGGSMETLIVGSKVRAMIKSGGCNVAGDALDGLNGVVFYYVDQACKRAAANGRKTVRAHDFHLM